MLHEVAAEGLINEKSGKRGNLYMKFNIRFPTELSETTKKELRTLLA
jgi:DnaJ-class molecular chaperone